MSLQGKSPNSIKKTNYAELQWLDEDVDFLAISEPGQLSDFASKIKEKFSHNLKEGQVVAARIVEIKNDVIVLDIGYKSNGEVSKSEFELSSHVPCNLAVGDTVDVFLEAFEDDDGELVLSKDKADMLKAWDGISEAFERGELEY